MVQVSHRLDNSPLASQTRWVSGRGRAGSMSGWPAPCARATHMADLQVLPTLHTISQVYRRELPQPSFLAVTMHCKRQL